VGLFAALLLVCGPAVAEPRFRHELETLDRGAGRAPLEVLIKRPEGEPERPLPALVVLGGFETGARALDYLHPEKPVVLVTFEYPYAGPKKFRFPRTLLDAPRAKEAVAWTPGDLSAVRAMLEKKPYVDKERLCVLGASFGAPFAVRAAAADPAVKCLVIVHGFAGVRGTTASRMRQLWRKNLGIFTRPSAWTLAALLSLYLSPPEPAKDAPRLREDQRVLMVEAEADTIIPPRARQALWDALGKSQAKRERVLMPGDHLLGDKTARTIKDIMAVVERWVPVTGEGAGTP
jgi:dienelactone hydrolase